MLTTECTLCLTDEPSVRYWFFALVPDKTLSLSWLGIMFAELVLFFSLSSLLLFPP
jgi:hypothetical protein